MKPLRLLSTSAILAISSIVAISTCAQTTTITDNQGLVYNILTESSAGTPGTCAVGNNQSFSGDAVIPYSVENNSNTYIVTQISDYAFSDGTAYPENTSLTSIDFSGCTALTSIGIYAFYYCTALTSIDLSNKVNLISIGGDAFSGCHAVESINLSGCSNLQTLDYYAFGNCYGLTSIDFSGCTSLTSIGMNAFFMAAYNIPGSTSIDLSPCTSLTSIGRQAFRTSSLVSVILPESLQTIGYNAFIHSQYLTSVTCYAVNPPSVDTSNSGSLDTSIFDVPPMTTTGTLYVPTCSVDAYKQDQYWGKAGNIVPIGTVSSLNISSSSLELNIGGEAQTITLSYTPEDAPIPQIDWTFSEQDIAEIITDPANPLSVSVKPLSPGNTILTAKVNPGDNADCWNDIDISEITCEITVIAENPITQINLSLSDFTIAKGAEPVMVSATIAPENASYPELTWSIEPQGFAEIQSIQNTTLSVNISPIAAGTATITATAADGSETTAQCAVTVVELTADDIIIGSDNPDNPGSSWGSIMTDGVTLHVGESLNVSVRSDKADYLPEITWSTLDPAIASVTPFENKNTDATLRGVAVGQTSLSLSVEGIDGTITAPVYVIAATTTETINLSLTDFTMAENAEPVQITATITPESVTHPVLTWSVEPDDIVEIIADSNPDNTLSISVKPLAPGEVTLTATAQDGSGTNASCEITVVKLTGVEIGATGDSDGGNDGDDNTGSGSGSGSGSWSSIMTDGATLTVGETIALSVRTTPAVDFAPAITWSTAETSIASVTTDADNSLNATLTGIATGKTTLTVSAGNLTSSANITVTAPVVRTLSISPSKLTIDDGASETLTAEYTPSDAEAQLTWTVDNVAVIGLVQTADGMNATLTALKPGTATVTLTESISGLEATCTVTVVEVPVTALNLNIEDATIDIQDGPLMLSVTINPAEATVPALAWKSSDENVATVTNALGLQAQINPLSAGTAVITVSHADDPTIFDNCTITVTDKSSLGEVFTDGTFSGPVDVYDLSGRLVRRQATESDLQELRPGIYIFRQGTTSRKILIQ